mmetsp:Transcript_22648/g.37137  ORF Transcript_22648/g.37137 Transcript_22648/m.37137 type:complete len:344 (-) Transcript_22648:2739-3770(-)
MANRHLPARLCKGRRQAFCHCHRSVLPARTSKGDRQVRFALFQIGWQQPQNHVADLVFELRDPWVTFDMGLYRRVFAGAMPQVRIPERVLEEPAVKDHIDRPRQTSLVAKALNRHSQLALVTGRKPMLHLGAQLMHIQRGRVDQDVRARPQGGQKLQFALNACLHPVRCRQRMSAAGLGEAVQKHVGAAIEIQKLWHKARDRRDLPQSIRHRRDRKVAVARIYPQGQLRIGSGIVQQRTQEPQGHIVDGLIAEIFKDANGAGSASAGGACHQNDAAMSWCFNDHDGSLRDPLRYCNIAAGQAGFSTLCKQSRVWPKSVVTWRCGRRSFSTLSRSTTNVIGAAT